MAQEETIQGNETVARTVVPDVSGGDNAASVTVPPPAYPNKPEGWDDARYKWGLITDIPLKQYQK